MPKYAESSQSKEFAVSWLLGLTALVADINILDSAQFDLKCYEPNFDVTILIEFRRLKFYI